MINKIAAAIGNATAAAAAAASGAPPPPPVQTANSIRLMQPLKASHAGGVETRKFSTQLKHQFEAVNTQVDHGLTHVKRTCSYMAELLRASEYSGDGRRATSDLSSKWSEGEVLRDEAMHFVHGCTLLQEVTMHSYAATESFRKHAQQEVAALHSFYKTAQAKRRELTKEHARMLSSWASTEDALGKERRDCVKSYAELRAAQDAKDREEVAETANKELYPKLLKKLKAAREACVRKFAAFEKSFERARALQESNDSTHLPHLLSELEALERERLHQLSGFTARFGALFAAWSDDIRSSCVLIEKVAPALQAEKTLSSLLDSWMLRFGAPPPLQPVRYDLPCTAAVIAGEELPPENAPLLATNGSSGGWTPHSNGALSSASPSASAGSPLSSLFSSPPMSPTATGVKRSVTPGPPPLPLSASSSSMGSGSYPPLARTASGNAKAASPVTPLSPIASRSAGAPPPPASATAVSATAASPATAATAPTSSLSSPGAVRPPVKIGVIGRAARAPPPSLPTKRKPKVPGEPDIDISLLPPPPLPPPVTQESASYHRMSMTTAAAAAAAAATSVARRQSVAQGSGTPSLPDAASETSAAAAASSPSASSALRGPPPLPAGTGTATGTSRTGPPPPPPPNPVVAATPAEPAAQTQQLNAAPVVAALTPAASIAAPSTASRPAASSASMTEDFDASALVPDDDAEEAPVKAQPPVAAASAAPEVAPAEPAPAVAIAATPAAGAAPRVEAASVPPVTAAADSSLPAESAVAVDDGTVPADDSASGGGEEEAHGWPATALYDFTLQEDTADIHYLSFSAGDRLLILHNDGGDWLYGSNGVDAGFFAANYVEMDEA